MVNAFPLALAIALPTPVGLQTGWSLKTCHSNSKAGPTTTLGKITQAPLAHSTENHNIRFCEGVTNDAGTMTNWLRSPAEEAFVYTAIACYRFIWRACSRRLMETSAICGERRRAIG